ncbi:MAG: electron transport complex subunit RsxC [Nitrospinae bacterium]|nr:electron transport complex subunit RsxC [Nitrospinota bacterium]
MTFRGGIHPPEEKDRTKGIPIQTIPLPEKVVIPLSQHTGAICEPLVKVGDIVKKGQKIGEGKGSITSTVHSSISGKVVDISPHPHPLGSDILSIIIESDKKDEWVDSLTENEDYLSIEPAKLKEIIKDAGIVGLGGAQFPTHIKLSPPEGDRVEYVIINGAECEPYITSDHRLMVERASEIVEGLKIIMRVLSAKKGFIGIEKNKPDAIAKLKAQSSKLKAHIEVVGLNVKYPQGAEKQLIKSILKKEVPPSVFPIEAGVVVNNVGTAYAIYNAVRYGRPLIERVVTVTGNGVKDPGNLLARIGASFEFLIQNCGGFSGEPEKVIMGGPMMGIAQYTLKVPAIKGTSGIVVFSKNPPSSPFNKGGQGGLYQPCIRCGRCVDNCPMGISPNLYGLQAERGMIDEAYNWDVMDCIECGACSYVCPSNRPLVQFIKYLKAEVKKKQK